MKEISYKEVQSTLITSMYIAAEILKINITTKYIFFCQTNYIVHSWQAGLKINLTIPYT